MTRDTRQSRILTFVEPFVSALASIELENVFNPYLNVCSEHDDAFSPDIRRRNLVLYLSRTFEVQLETAWIGRDLGYRGGRRTGLPLTDEEHLPTFSKVFKVPASKATRTTDARERTAAEIWRVIQQLEKPPFLWNAFPFHPHEPGGPMNNRCHTKKEFGACEELLTTLLDSLRFSRIFVLGNDAAKAMQRLGKPCTYIRHPSYGGRGEFRRQMADAYDLDLN